MKKVLFLITKSNWGGAQRYVFDLATHLPTNDFEAVVACGPAQDSNKVGHLVERLVTAGIRTITVPELVRDIGATEFATFASIRRILAAERPDVLHLNSSKAAGLGALAGRTVGIRRIVFTAHGWPFGEARNPLWRAFAWAASMTTILLVHKVICVSEKDFRSVPAILRSKCMMIHNAVDSDPLQLDRETARAHLVAMGMPETFLNRPLLGIIAEHTATKDIGTALGALSRVLLSEPNDPPVLVLMGEGEQTAYLKSMSDYLKITTSTYFAGFVADASRYLLAFDALLLTSRKEGLPYAILEARAAGIPVVASSVGGIPELVSDMHDGFLCPPGDEQCFADAILGLSTLPAIHIDAASFATMFQKTVEQY